MGDTVQITMPQMGESVSEGTILTWHKQEGDWVEKDETIVEVSTDKVDAEVPAPASGKLVKILAQEDETVAVGPGAGRARAQRRRAAACILGRRLARNARGRTRVPADRSRDGHRDGDHGNGCPQHSSRARAPPRRTESTSPR